METRNSLPGLWMQQVGPLTPRVSLQENISADVVIVGAGYTGLWTAYYLLSSALNLDVVVLEKETVGFGASGRNGGWCSALFAAEPAKVARVYGHDAAVAMQREMIATIDEVGQIVDAEGIDCGFHKGGTLVLATAPTHVARVRHLVDEAIRWGFDGHYEWLDAHQVWRRLRVASCFGAAFTPDCARLHPAKLVRGLADAVERNGGRIYERTPVDAIEAGVVRAGSGTVRAPVSVRATEGYTALFPGLRRSLVPLYSLMIATEPLPAEIWDEIGWEGRETFTDGRHLLIYAQRTPDDRIAFGGRGAPYHFGSRISDGFDHDVRVFNDLQRVLISLFPQLDEIEITHRWGGPVGVPRDWFTSIGLDRVRGLAWAGGYVGDGVSTSNLAARTLADLILERDSELTTLPWVGHSSPSWEPEPLRWAGINLALRLMAGADRAEEKTGKPSRRGRLVRRLIGL